MDANNVEEEIIYYPENDLYFLWGKNKWRKIILYIILFFSFVLLLDFLFPKKITFAKITQIIVEKDSSLNINSKSYTLKTSSGELYINNNSKAENLQINDSLKTTSTKFTHKNIATESYKNNVSTIFSLLEIPYNVLFLYLPILMIISTILSLFFYRRMNFSASMFVVACLLFFISIVSLLI